MLAPESPERETQDVQRASLYRSFSPPPFAGIVPESHRYTLNERDLGTNEGQLIG